MKSSISLSSSSNSRKITKISNHSAGAVFIEAAVSVGVLSLICFGGVELISNVNRKLDLQDVLRRSAMSIQEFNLNPDPSLGDVCTRAESLIEENLESSGFNPTDYQITACPITLGSDDNEPKVGSLRIGVQSQSLTPWIHMRNSVSAVSVMQQSIFFKVQELNCLGVRPACS